MKNPNIFSGPINHGLPSILDLPAQLRELVYNFLLRRPGPVLLHNREAYYAKQPGARSPYNGYAQIGDRFEPLTRYSYEIWQQEHAEEKEADNGFRHHLGTASIP